MSRYKKQSLKVTILCTSKNKKINLPVKEKWRFPGEENNYIE